VNKLSGHFPWFEVDTFAPCDEATMVQYYGRLAFDLLMRAPLPNFSLLDACKSNKYMLSILSGNMFTFAKKEELESCEAVT
jgi:hypothetical protein